MNEIMKCFQGTEVHFRRVGIPLALPQNELQERFIPPSVQTFSAIFPKSCTIADISSKKLGTVLS